MKQTCIPYDHLDIGDRLFCVLTANVHEITRPVQLQKGNGSGYFTLCTSPTNMCFRFSDGTEIAIEDLLVYGGDQRAYLYGFEKIPREEAA